MSKRLFFICLTLGWICSIAGCVLIFTTRSLLPDVLKDYLHTRHLSLGLSSACIWGLLALAYLCATFAANVGVYFWRLWARAVYTLALPLGWCFLLPMGNDPEVRTLWVEIPSGLSAMFTGIAICAMWFVPGISDRFEKMDQSAQQSPPPVPLSPAGHSEDEG